MEKRHILNNKIYLYMTEFFSGMSLMAVELGASRLLAPYFSSSQIVWTIIIGTIMIAMALGNIYGGRAADKNPDPDRLYRRIIIAAVWIGLIPVLGKYIIIAISAVMIFSVNSNFLIWAAFAACMIIFVFPLFLLGTVTPSLVKYTVDDLEDSGTTVGMLNASNTIGSIIGTFVPTFVTIPAVGTSITFLIFASILLALSVAYFVSGKKISAGSAAGIVIIIICWIFGRSDSFAFWEDNLIHESESVYNYLQVKEDESQIALSTHVVFGVQSVYEKNNSLTGLYYDYALAAPMMAGVNKSDNMDILILGMGTGTFATMCDRYYSDVTKLSIEGVEIDEDITKLARKYFHLSKDIPVYEYDGRAYLNAVKKKYDVIMVDAYQDITIPFQMSSKEFFTLVKEHLKENGVMVVNMNMRGKKKGSINEYLSDTIGSVFENIYTADVSGSTNCELFASDNNNLLMALRENAVLENDKDLAILIGEVSDKLAEYKPGDRVMTDDKAPVELLGMRIIDDLISVEVGVYKDIYKKDGIKGLINSLR